MLVCGPEPTELECLSDLEKQGVLWPTSTSRKPNHFAEMRPMAAQVKAAGTQSGPGTELSQSDTSIGLLNISCIPLALTCGLYNGKLIADPTAEEEELMQTLLTVTLTASARVVGKHFCTPQMH